MSAETDSFWSFATAVYDRAGMSAACLALQDSFGADVNVLLFCVWLGAHGRPFAPCADRSLALSRLWQTTVVAPLRAGRRALSEIAGREEASELETAAVFKLRETIKAAELAAEKLEIDALARSASGIPDGAMAQEPRSNALANLRSYFDAANIRLDPLGDAALLRILDLAFSR